MRVAGYADPFQRRSAEDFADRYNPDPTPAQQAAFTAWLRPLVNTVDVILVHEPELIAGALEGLRRDSRPRTRSCSRSGTRTWRGSPVSAT